MSSMKRVFSLTVFLLVLSLVLAFLAANFLPRSIWGYRLQDAAAIAQYQGKKIRDKITRAARKFFIRKDNQPPPKEVDSFLNPVVVSESGLPEED